jgi:hypothetical protein
VSEEEKKRSKEGPMTAAVTRERKQEIVVTAEPPVSRALEDRIAADGVQVAHTLDPDREPGTVRYPDPQAPHARDDGRALAPQSNAEIQMAHAAPTPARKKGRPGATSADRSTLLLWGAGAAGLFLMIGVLIALF